MENRIIDFNKPTPMNDYITAEQLINMKIGNQIIVTTSQGTKFRIKKTNESERCFTLYNLSNKVAVCSRCKAEYILESKVY